MADQQKYKVVERIDAGGMAEVFRGVAESIQGFKKAVAIKRILPNLTRKPKFVAMFLDEARLSLHLQHANIVQVFDIGVADNTYFIVMEYINGGNLRTIIDSLRRQGRRMKIEHTIYLMMEVCKGLGYAHDMHDPESGRPLGIVHRDISPPNILISRQGEVKLVDFGLAKAASQVENTEPGVVKGKFSYLSPEAAEGKEVDHRSDIFAVGIVLFELLSGRRLFYGDTDYDTVQLVRQARIPSLKALNPEIETQLEEVVRRSLARDVVDRYQHAADLQDALAQYLFSRGMKVTNRDIAQLVQQCLKEKERSAPPKPKVSNIIDALIAEEIVKFTSLGEEEGGAGGGSDLLDGSRPLRPEEISDSHSGSTSDMVDTRSWLDELDVGRSGELMPPKVAAPAAPPRGAPGAAEGAPRPQPPAGGKKSAPVPTAAPRAPSGPQAGASRGNGQRAKSASMPPRVATPIGEGTGGGDLLQQMASPSEVAVPAAQRPIADERDRTPPAPARRWLLYVAVVAVVALAGVAVGLAFKLGLIGG